MGSNILGGWAFLVGVVIAIIAGFFGGLSSATVVIVLVVIGLIVGLLNISAKEVSPFLLAAVVLVIVSAFGKDVLSVLPYNWGVNILDAIMALIVPAAVIVAIREVFTLARK